jgi:hypothetical protein
VSSGTTQGRWARAAAGERRRAHRVASSDGERGGGREEAGG